jgi:hypothetical protein
MSFGTRQKRFLRKGFEYNSVSAYCVSGKPIRSGTTSGVRLGVSGQMSMYPDLDCLAWRGTTCPKMPRKAWWKRQSVITIDVYIVEAFVIF